MTFQEVNRETLPPNVTPGTHAASAGRQEEIASHLCVQAAMKFLKKERKKGTKTLAADSTMEREQ